jgi:hypothetical protein
MAFFETGCVEIMVSFPLTRGSIRKFFPVIWDTVFTTAWMSASWKLNIISPGRSAGPAGGAGDAGAGVIGLGVALRAGAGAGNGARAAPPEGAAGVAAAGGCPSVIGRASCAMTCGAARKSPVSKPTSAAMARCRRQVGFVFTTFVLEIGIRCARTD